MARPQKKLDAAQVENYAKLGASDREIGDMLGVAHTTISRRFAPMLAKARSERKTMLRKMQWDCAKGGNATMLIWLGKNELGQSDAMDITSGGKALTVKILSGVSMKDI